MMGNRGQEMLAADTRAAAKLTTEQREEMVERFLRGEHRATVAAAFGVDASLPSLRAYTGNVLNAEPVEQISEGE